MPRDKPSQDALQKAISVEEVICSKVEHVKHGDISTTAMDISFSILFEFYFIFSLYFEALLYYLYRSFHAYVIRASKRQRHC